MGRLRTLVLFTLAWVFTASLVNTDLSPLFFLSIQLAKDVPPRDIRLLDKNGHEHRITLSENEYDPCLSPDGNHAVFVRKIGTSGQGLASNEALTQIWIMETTAPMSSQLLVDSPLEINGRTVSVFSSPQFSPEGEKVYFLVDSASVTNTIVSLDIATKETRFITSAHQFRVVMSGKYKGDLIAQVRKAKLATGYYEWFWLVSPRGDEIDVVGQDEGDVDDFLEMYAQ
jgi:Tol biopolymer transport system component